MGFRLLCWTFCLLALEARLAGAAAHPQRLLVQPRPGVAPEALLNEPLLQDARIRRVFRRLENWTVLEWPDAVPAPRPSQLRPLASIRRVEPDYAVTSALAPDDPRFQDQSQWALHNTGQNGGTPDWDIDAPEGWEIAALASMIVVAVIDTGARLDHPDLAPNLWTHPGEIPGNLIDDDGNGYVDDVHGIDARTGSGDPNDENGHGTHVAGIIGAAGNNGLGVAGVCWRVQLMPLRFQDAEGYGFLSDAIECMEYARAMGAHILNFSWLEEEHSEAFLQALQAARAAGILIAAAAGNESRNIDEQPNYPSAYELDHVVVVGATARFGWLDGYSNYGSNRVHLAAPGTDVISTWHDPLEPYYRLSGTSMAAPHVAGILALLKQRFPGKTAAELIGLLLAGARKDPALEGTSRTGGMAKLAASFQVVAQFSATPKRGTHPLEVRLANASAGAVESVHWDFGDGNVSGEWSPLHTYHYPGTYRVRLRVRGGTFEDAAELEVVVLPRYEVEPQPIEWIAPAEHPLIAAGSTIPVSFPFTFFGQPVTALHAGHHGFLSVAEEGLLEHQNSNLPSSGAPNGAIYAYWDHLLPHLISAQTVGTSPGRKLVVTWRQALPAGAVPSPDQPALEFQVVLHERRHEILFQYRAAGEEWLAGGGAASATLGLEDPLGQVAFTLHHEPGTQPLRSGTAFRWTPWQFLPPVAPRLTSWPDGTLELRGDGGKRYRLEGSTDLAAWELLEEPELPASGLWRKQLLPINTRFYRAAGLAPD